jgi:hypothetical protein
MLQTWETVNESDGDEALLNSNNSKINWKMISELQGSTRILKLLNCVHL